tara:strand:+ start:123 stop:350 length:228 start_codon:yes stop_codon:yes gene_type:complete
MEELAKIIEASILMFGHNRIEVSITPKLYDSIKDEFYELANVDGANEKRMLFMGITVKRHKVGEINALGVVELKP